jgi:glycosyltransferase involved in cell wall biosynthesis
VVARRLAWLTRRYAVGVLCLRSPGEAQVDPDISSLCAFVEEIPRRTGLRWASRLRRSFRFARSSLPGGLPARAAAFDVGDYHRRLREVITQWQPHIVQAEHRIMAQYLQDVPAWSVPRVLVEHDSQWLLARELAELRRGPGRLAALLDASAWMRFECRTSASIDCVVTFSERDREAVARHVADSSIVTIPPVVELPERTADPLGVSPPRLLFVGMYRHLPNVDAAERLTKSILPRVRESFSSASLDLVGAQLPAALRAQTPGVVVAEDVPDIRPYLDRAAVVTAPVRFGSGVRIKVLEALAAGKAVVASPRAVEGIDVVSGEHLLVADGDEEFAAAIVELLQDPERRTSLASAARAWAERELGSSRHLKAYGELYESLLTDAAVSS